ncbi:MAG: DUF2939 domain-containing protein [Deferribacterales bacterium]
MKKRILAVTTLVIIFFAVYFASPFYALYSIRSAGEEGNADKLSGYVDYPKLRENLKATFNARVAKELANSEYAGALGALGTAFAASIVDQLVDSLVTPEALAMVMKNGIKPKGGDDDAGQSEDGQSSENTAKEKDSGKSVDFSSGYRSLNKFAFTITQEKESPVSMIFERHGLFSWKLVGMEI